VCTFWVLAKRSCHCCAIATSGKQRVSPAIKIRIGIAQRFCFCKYLFFLPKKCTDLDLSLLYILTLGIYSRFAWNIHFPALGVCFPQPCSSAGRRFAASRSRLQNYRRIVVFPQQKYSMKCVLNWIPLRNRVRLRNTQPHLKNAIFLCKLKRGQFKRWGQKNRHTEVLAPKLLPHAQNSSPHQFSCRFHKLTRRVKYPYVLILL